MTVLRFPSRPRSQARLTQVSPRHPSLGMLWALENDQPEGSILDLFPEEPQHHISCADCTMVNSKACADCVVSLLADGPADSRSVTLDAAEAETIDLFSRVGLVPRVRHTCDRVPGRAASW